MYRCLYPECKFKCKSETQIVEHLKSHSEKGKKEKMITCDYHGCNEEFPNEEELIKHMCSHIGQKRYPCPMKDCPVVKLSQKDIAKHFKTHNLSKWRCPIEGCKKSFLLPQQLKRHVQHHKGKASTKENDLSEDISESSDEYDELRCPFTGCSKKFSSTKELQEHIQNHRKKPGPTP